MIHYMTGTTYFTPEQITRLIDSAWMGPQQYLVEVAPTVGNPYLTFVPTCELAPIIFPVCHACGGARYQWESVGWQDEVEKRPCEACAS